MLRVAALVRDDGSVEVVLRSSVTSFAIDHFHCFCRFEDAPAESAATAVPLSRLAVEPERDLYGSLLFQTGRFRRLAGYRDLSAEQSWLRSPLPQASHGSALTFPLRFCSGMPGGSRCGHPFHSGLRAACRAASGGNRTAEAGLS